MLARQVVEPGSEGLDLIVQTFGSRVLNSDATLNRSELASIVFSDNALLRKLESITHPLIRELANHLISVSDVEIIVYVIPLLVESRSDLEFDFVVTVEAPQPEQLKRLTENRGLSLTEALARINSQATPAERANAADRILNSNQSLALLLSDAKTLFRDIQRLANEKTQENDV